MVFETLNLILSTALSITFMQCCKIVLMFYNGSDMKRQHKQNLILTKYQIK